MGVIKKPLKVKGAALRQRRLPQEIAAARNRRDLGDLCAAAEYSTAGSDFFETVRAFVSAIASGELPEKGVNSVRLLLQGYALGLALALAFTMLAAI